MAQGSALTRAAAELIEKGKKIAAALFETNAASITYSDGIYSGRDTNQTVSLAEIVERSLSMEPNPLETVFTQAVPRAFSSGATWPKSRLIAIPDRFVWSPLSPLMISGPSSTMRWRMVKCMAVWFRRRVKCLVSNAFTIAVASFSREVSWTTSCREPRRCRQFSPNSCQHGAPQMSSAPRESGGWCNGWCCGNHECHRSCVAKRRYRRISDAGDVRPDLACAAWRQALNGKICRRTDTVSLRTITSAALVRRCVDTSNSPS